MSPAQTQRSFILLSLSDPFNATDPLERVKAELSK